MEDLSDLEELSDRSFMSTEALESQIRQLQDRISNSRLLARNLATDNDNLIDDLIDDDPELISLPDGSRSWGSLSTLSQETDRSSSRLSIFDELESETFSNHSEDFADATPRTDMQSQTFIISIQSLQIPKWFNLSDSFNLTCAGVTTKIKTPMALVPSKKDKSILQIRKGALKPLSIVLDGYAEGIPIKIWPDLSDKATKSSNQWAFSGTISRAQLMQATSRSHSEIFITFLPDIKYTGKRDIRPSLGLAWRLDMELNKPSPTALSTQTLEPKFSINDSNPANMGSSIRPHLLYFHVYIQEVSLFDLDSDHSFYAIVKIPNLGTISQCTFFCNQFVTNQLGDKTGIAEFHYTVPLGIKHKSQSMIIEAYSSTYAAASREEKFIGIARFPLTILNSIIHDNTMQSDQCHDSHYLVLPSSRIPIMDLLTGQMKGYLNIAAAIGPWEKIQEFKQTIKQIPDESKKKEDLCPSYDSESQVVSHNSSPVRNEDMTRKNSLQVASQNGSSIQYQAAEFNIRLMIHNLYGLNLLLPFSERDASGISNFEVFLEFKLPECLESDVSKHNVQTDAILLCYTNKMDFPLDISLPGNNAHFPVMDQLWIQGYVWYKNSMEIRESGHQLLGRFQIPFSQFLYQPITNMLITIQPNSLFAGPRALLEISCVPPTRSHLEDSLHLTKSREQLPYRKLQKSQLRITSFHIVQPEDSPFHALKDITVGWDIQTPLYYGIETRDYQELPGQHLTLEKYIMETILDDSASVYLLFYLDGLILGRTLIDLKPALESFLVEFDSSSDRSTAISFSQISPIVPGKGVLDNSLTGLSVHLDLEWASLTDPVCDSQPLSHGPTRAPHLTLSIERGLNIILQNFAAGEMPNTFLHVTTEMSQYVELASDRTSSEFAHNTNNPTWRFTQQLRITKLPGGLFSFDSADEPFLTLEIWHVFTSFLQENPSFSATNLMSAQLKRLAEEGNIQLIGYVTVPLGVLLQSLDMIEGWYNITDPSNTLETRGDVFLSIAPVDDFLQLIRSRQKAGIEQS